jgi:hypothetical protein
MNRLLWRPVPTKLRLYEALYALNQGFESTLEGLERLEQLGLFRLENLNAFKVTLERTRAEANEELVQTLQGYEEDESARFDRMERDWQRQYQDPDDVFIAARNRKQQIKEQIKERQKGLERQSERRKVKKKH